MGLFGFFKNKSPKKEYFSADIKSKNLSLEETNAQYLDMREKEVENIRKAYDLDSLSGIRSIPVPCKEVNGSSPTGRVEYYLRSACFFNYWESGKKDLAIECLKKAQELMYVSDMIWKENDFMRLVSYLHEYGMHREAEAEHQRIKEFFNKSESRFRDSVWETALSQARKLNTDLIILDDALVCCEQCALYRRRVYSISGKDRRFPLLPNSVHTKCGLLPQPFLEGISNFSFDCKNIVKYSNRPFKDDRTKEEIEKYNSWKMRMNEIEEKNKRLDENRTEYFWVQENLPSLCPKSLSGYSRMKNLNSKTFKEIVKEAEKLGKIIAPSNL